MSQIPNDLDAEESVLGAMLMSDLAVDAVSDVLATSDFYNPSHGVIYDAILKLRQSGSPVDAVTVSSALAEAGMLESIGGNAILGKIQMDTPSVSGAAHYAQIVIDRALRRRMMQEGHALAQYAADMTIDAGDTLETHQAVVSQLGTVMIDAEPDDVSVEEFINRPREKMERWAVHHLVRRQHKLMLVGGEGAGKSWILRFIAICAAYGVQPFRHEKIKPIRTLIVDLENPEDALYDSFETILRTVTRFNPRDDASSRLWWRPAGINLRSRVDAAALENVIRTRRPDLVCLGPLYAAYDNSGKDFSWETAAREVQSTLKQLMVRYDFGLMIEDHAPQDRSGGMRPYGSSFWRRWPDIGIGMEPVTGSDTAFRVNHWRGSRVKTDWPSVIERGDAVGSPWPFVATWD